jgi:hypothetical protein
MRYRSKAQMFGLPLLCVAVGPDMATQEMRGLARGIVAIGDIAIGYQALGGLAIGYYSTGGLSIGVHPQGGTVIQWPFM